MIRNKLINLTALALLSGCVQLPSSPSVAVMPAPGKPFDLFVSEEAMCRDFASQQIGASPQQVQQNNVVTGGIGGAAVGAAGGAIIGAASGHAGPGAAIGAGTGLIAGSAVGAQHGYGDLWTLQRRYDIAYEQCMYAKGNQIPGAPAASYAPASIPPPPPSYLPAPG